MLYRGVECRTASSALLKFNKMTTTYGLERSILVMVFRREMIAVVVEPVRQKANWSVIERAGGEKEGRINKVTVRCALHDSGQN
jgi:hypothetical protein